MKHSSGKPWWNHLAWALSAGLFGFVVAAVFAGVLQLPRNVYLIPYFLLVSILLYEYVRWSRVNVIEALRHHLVWGLVGAVVVGFFTVQTVLIQPASPPPQGVEFAFDLVWLGIVYGTMDGLLLSVLPVCATWRAMEIKGWTERWRGRIAIGAFALAISMIVILLYHLGYPECRGPQVLMITVGVSVMSLAYLITRNPLAPILAHVGMHIAAVLHGLNTVSQLPPHYYQQITAVAVITTSLVH